MGKTVEFPVGGGRLSGRFALDRATNHEDVRARSNALVEVGYVFAAHANAAEGGWGAKAAFFWGAVNVNGAAESILIAGLCAGQPEDAGDDWVAARSIWRDDFPSGTAVLEDAADWSVATNFFGHLHSSKWGAVAIRPVAHAKFRSRYFVSFDRRAVTDKQHFLIAHADDHFIPVVFSEGQGI